jgi:hypothetical protein
MLRAAAEETGRSLEDEFYVRLLDSLNGWSEVQSLRRDLDEMRAAAGRLIHPNARG